MSEAERLQKIIQAQEKELRRLRKLLGTCRVASVEFVAEDSTLRVVATCVGVDEYYFTEQLKPELTAIAQALIGRLGTAEIKGEITDSITGEALEGAVSAGSAD